MRACARTGVIAPAARPAPPLGARWHNLPILCAYVCMYKVTVSIIPDNGRGASLNENHKAMLWSLSIVDSVLLNVSCIPSAVLIA